MSATIPEWLTLQLRERIAELDAHDEETYRLLIQRPVPEAGTFPARDDRRKVLDLRVVETARIIARMAQ